MLSLNHAISLIFDIYDFEREIIFFNTDWKQYFLVNWLIMEKIVIF